MNLTHSTTMLETQAGLKKLALTGMLNCFNDRNQEAIANKMSYQEFLSILIQDELLLREQRRYERRCKKASFKSGKTIESFDFSFNPKINQKLIRDLATCRFITEKAPVLVMGPCGTGKSHIAQAIGHCAIQKGFDVLYTTQSKLSEELRAAKAVNAYARKLKSLAKVHLLIIDDLGLKPLHSPQDEHVHAVIEERYESASTIITSNLALLEWQQAFTNQLLGIATIDRMRHDSYQLILEGSSYRRAKKTQK